MTHFADLSSWELAQKLMKKLPELQARGVKVVVIGLGSVGNARRFAEVLSFPLDLLHADSTGAMYRALGFSQGFAPNANVSPYLKLLPMLMGIGSPGTIQEVLRGYIGDRSAKPVFEGSTPFNILGGGYQRPFELATLRLSNMIGILPKWSELCPPDEALLTQQGGSLLFRGDQVIFRHTDSGILKYTDLDALLAAVPAVQMLPN
ncbi:g5571 [Coccomyxa elongata]